MPEYIYNNDRKRLTLFKNTRERVFKGSLVIAGQVVLSLIPSVSEIAKPKKNNLNPLELHLRRQREINPAQIDLVDPEDLILQGAKNSSKKFPNLSDVIMPPIEGWRSSLNFFNEVVNLMAGIPSKFNGTLSKRMLKLGAMTCLVIALSGYIYAVLPVVAAEISTKLTSSTSSQIDNREVIAKTSLSVNLPPFATPNPSPLPVDLQDFSIYIPKINLSSNIIANVDPNSQEAYEVELQNGVAHAKGSYLPSEGGSVFLFAHSTDTVFNILKYNAKFYAVKELSIGDEILIEFDHHKYRYVINNKMIVNPSDLEVVRGINSNLILSTCYPPGTSLQRLIIFAERSP